MTKKNLPSFVPSPSDGTIDLWVEDDADEMGRLLTTAVLYEEELRKRREQQRVAGLFLEMPREDLMYPPDHPARKR